MFHLCSLFSRNNNNDDKNDVAAYCVSSLRKVGDVSDQWCIICQNNEVIYSDKYLPQKLKHGEICWLVPINGVTVNIENHNNNEITVTQFCIEFDLLDLHNGNFCNFAAGKKKINITEIQALVRQKWLSLKNSERNQTNLNITLAENGLTCTELSTRSEIDQTLLDNAILDFKPYIFLPDPNQNGCRQCWEDNNSISVVKNRFTRRDDLEKILPVKIQSQQNIFNTTKIQFGRSSSTNIPLQLPDEILSNLFSGLHLNLELTTEGIFLTDLSTNGTHFNGQRLKKNERFPVPKNQKKFSLRFSFLLEMQLETKIFAPVASQWSKQNCLPEDILFRLELFDKEKYELAKYLNIRSIHIKHAEHLTVNTDTINYYTEQSVAEKINDLKNKSQLNPNYGQEFEIVLY
ncbi:MAG: FHA domain-containing protein [Planctomycetaceae bacterium]|jgi:pSer/pThr/pTyr-binding forkhead associated (FHA) protein|nr:FHA domain-containing protein [Planctomycetaceae bacterium]